MSPLSQPDPLDLLRTRLAERGTAIHMAGIGGVGMAGLARLLLDRGFRVSGSEAKPNSLTDWLVSLGARIFAGHAASHVPADARLLIRTPAVPSDNPEVGEARRLGIPVALRGEALPVVCETRRLIGVSGTHGKTSTTAMIAGMLRHAGVHCGWCIGGEPRGLGGVADPGDSPWLACECDESDGTLVHYQPAIAVITNIEFDHMEHFSDEEEMLGCFRTFAARSESRVCCADDPAARALVASGDAGMSYGFDVSARLRAVAVREASGTVSAQVHLEGKRVGDLRLEVGGRHNLQNALGALATGLCAGLDPSLLLPFFPTFRPVARRFEWIRRDGPVQVVSDYAHHPTEIRSVLEVARRTGRRLVAVYQPHRYTRTQRLGPLFPPAFDGLAHLVLAPVYAASESPIPGGNSSDLFRLVQGRGTVDCELAVNLSDAWRRLQAVLREGDLLLVMGAGDVNAIAGWASEPGTFRSDVPPSNGIAYGKSVKSVKSNQID